MGSLSLKYRESPGVSYPPQEPELKGEAQQLV